MTNPQQSPAPVSKTPEPVIEVIEGIPVTITYALAKDADRQAQKLRDLWARVSQRLDVRS